ncbi:hypothetical protein GPECTOR_23g89 [Gonium pectorale]|uniref:Uncharacterized protein n=1 Tax=Gonium pectorale TaxID=33097 RepID=A0A150GH40_GONPE|nr:hypothetical protein GPECTOR_23g89 [Gonium pectorale]|eukprot:KXZ49162.1 hypothetical protein GPECTOR_23g89 [Gonium pectorale]
MRSACRPPPDPAPAQADQLQELLELVRGQGTELKTFGTELKTVGTELKTFGTELKTFGTRLDRLERTQGILVEAVAGAALRDREQPKALGSSARAGVVLRDAASVVECVLPCGLPQRVSVEAADVLVAWLIEENRGLRAILESELRAVPSRLGAVESPQDAEKNAAAAGAAQLEDSAQDPAKAAALQRGELCVPALTALHPPVSGAASSTAKQLEIGRLLPLRLSAAAGGSGKSGGNGDSSSDGSGDGGKGGDGVSGEAGGNGATSGDGGSTSGPDAGSSGTALLEVQEIKSSSVGLATARDQVARSGRVRACAYGVLRERLPHVRPDAAAWLPELRLRGTIALGHDDLPLATDEQLPRHQELCTADGRVHRMEMSYLVLSAGTLVPWVPSRQR